MLTLADTSKSQSELLSQAYKLRSSDHTQAIKLFKSVERSALTEDEKELYDLTEAYLHLMLGDASSAITAYEALSQPSHSFNLRFKAHAALTAINAATQNWTKAFDALDYLIENVDAVTDSEAKEQAHNAIINFYNSIDERQTVINYATPLMDGEYTKRFTCLLNMQLIVALVAAKDKSISEGAFDKAIDLCRNANEPIPIIAVYTHYATHLYNQDRIDEALSVLLKQLEAAEATQYRPVLEEYYALFSKIYLFKKEYEKAKEYAFKIVGENIKTEYSAISDIDAYEVLYKIAEIQNQCDQALAFHKSYAKAKSLNLSNTNSKMLSIQKARQDNLTKSNQIALLDTENSLLRAQAQLTTETSNNRKILIFVMLLVFLISVLWLYKKRSHYIQLEEISQKDGLTGIANRHFFTKNAVEIIDEALEQVTTVCFIMFDLDNFKHINDNYGHTAGDLALKAAVDAAKRGCREADLIGRLGGEEFGILMRNCALDKALDTAERSRSEIELTNETDQREYSLTASFGVASTEDVGYSFEKLFDAADSALYRSKNSGKNRVSY